MVENPHNGPIGVAHCISHHAVIREDKQTTKVCIVCNVSAKSTVPSLNDCLYVGPNLGQKHTRHPLSIHVFQIAVTPDIEKAFLMVLVAQEDHDVLRFFLVDDIIAPLPRLVTLQFARVVRSVF